MGIRHKLIHQISVFNRQLGGAYATREQRGRNGRQFVSWYVEILGRRLRRLADVDPGTLPEYAAYLSKRLKPGSIQTSIGSVRSLLRAAGVNLAGYESNRALGVPERSRDGTKLPFPDERFDDLLACAREIDPGMYHLVRLQRLLGLRGLESLMSGTSVEQWIDEIHYLRSVHVTAGTKGGRPRFTEILKGRAIETQEALREAIEYLQHNKHLMQGKGGDLESARSRYHALARKLGMTGEFAPHSLRYAWACEKARELIDLGLERREILSFLSAFLGHGASRGRWIKQVYIAGIVHLLPPPTRAARRLYKFLQKLDEVQAEES